MAIIINPEDFEKLRKKAKRKSIRRMKAIKSPGKSERLMRNKLNRLWDTAIVAEAERITALVRSGASPETLAIAIQGALKKYDFMYGAEADRIVEMWKLSVDNTTSSAITRALSNSLGIDITGLLETPKVADVLAIKGVEAANLIKTIPSDYLGQVAKAVADNFAGIPLPEGRSLLQQIMAINKVSRARANIIARDQTSKLTAALNQQRQESIGIDSYIWRTVKDQRVVGNPAGLYPKGNSKHGNHYEREGKVFKWSEPPPDGHPGTAINDRCRAEPIIDINNVLKFAKAA